VIVAEAEPHVGSGTSSRNSEVIHAGIYYPTGSLRERHCARSRRMLYGVLRLHGVPHKKLGKLVVVGRDADVRCWKSSMPRRHGTASRISACWTARHDPDGAALACVAAFHSPGNRNHRQPSLHAALQR